MHFLILLEVKGLIDATWRGGVSSVEDPSSQTLQVVFNETNENQRMSTSWENRKNRHVVDVAKQPRPRALIGQMARPLLIWSFDHWLWLSSLVTDHGLRKWCYQLFSSQEMFPTHVWRPILISDFSSWSIWPLISTSLDQSTTWIVNIDPLAIRNHLDQSRLLQDPNTPGPFHTLPLFSPAHSRKCASKPGPSNSVRSRW